MRQFLSSRSPAFGGEALDAGLDRHAARAAQQVEHVGAFHRSMRVWTPNLTGALRQRFQQVALRQENLVDEIDVFDALARSAVEFLEDPRAGAGDNGCGNFPWRRTCSDRGSRARPPSRLPGRGLGIEAVMMMVVPG